MIGIELFHKEVGVKYYLETFNMSRDKVEEFLNDISPYNETLNITQSQLRVCKRNYEAA